MRLVLDTNVVIELLHFRDPRSAPLMAAITAGSAECLTDAPCLAELRRVLGYPQFKLDVCAQEALCARYRTIAGIDDEPPIAAVLPLCRDADDQKFMELAARGRADLLVTRDRALLRLSGRWARPAAFGIVEPERAVEAIRGRRARFLEHRP